MFINESCAFVDEVDAAEVISVYVLLALLRDFRVPE
jgi:hypothetical protein